MYVLQLFRLRKLDDAYADCITGWAVVQALC